MRELTNSTEVQAKEIVDRTVTLFLNSGFTVLTGTWYWEMQADAVFCSDVMLSLPTSFAGVRGIIHPDDVSLLNEKLSSVNKFHLEFRIITSYGEVKLITGENISIAEVEKNLEDLQQHLFQTASDEAAWKKEYEHLMLSKEIYERSERYTGTGIWWYNDATREAWYSSQVYRIHDLPPQSLNPRLNTFNNYIHPEDRETVTAFMSRAFRKKAPLHIEYRIRTAVSEKYLRHTTQWLFNARGEAVLSGSMQDITEQKLEERKLDEAESIVAFYRQQVSFDEQHIALGHWNVNLLTRKTIFSDNYYRIFGLRPQAVPAGISGIINYVHPDDREAFNSAHKKMLYEHRLPEMDFRITRPDGKLRYLSQKARLVTSENELVMMGIIQDITAQKILENRINELADAEAVRNFAIAQSEEMSGTVGWTWNLEDGKITWSDNFHKLLGFKTPIPQLTPHKLLLYILPEDQKTYTDELTLILQQRQESSFELRILQRGQVRHLRASFRIMKTQATQIFIATFLDVTNEKSLENELRRRMQVAEGLSENILDCVMVTDVNNTIVVWNKRCEAVFKVEKQVALGKNFFDVFPQLKTEEALQLFTKVLKGESITLLRHRSLLGTGYFDLHMQPMWSEEKADVTGIIHIMHDVTRETELQKSLHERLSFIESLVDDSIDRIIAIDRNLNFLVWNRKCEACYGLQKEEVLGKNVLEIFPETQNTFAYEACKKVLNGETVHIPANFALDREHQHEVYLSPIKNENAEVIAILWIMHDLGNGCDMVS